MNSQVPPPSFSAIKVNGKRAYKLAREGKSVEIPSRKVRIDRLELVDRDKEPFTVQRRALYVEHRKSALKEATKEVSDFCGASICSTCVYVDMESLVEVNNYRTAKLVSERQALEAQAALNEARRELGMPNIG